jgi:hypothetical protein
MSEDAQNLAEIFVSSVLLWSMYQKTSSGWFPRYVRNLIVKSAQRCQSQKRKTIDYDDVDHAAKALGTAPW